MVQIKVGGITVFATSLYYLRLTSSNGSVYSNLLNLIK